MGKQAEHAASFDGPELRPVPHQHHLPDVLVGQEHQPGEIGGGDHRRLVDDEDLAATDLPARVGTAGSVPFVQQLGDCVRRQARLDGQDAGGGGGHSHAPHRDPRRLPRVTALRSLANHIEDLETRARRAVADDLGTDDV